MFSQTTFDGELHDELFYSLLKEIKENTATYNGKESQRPISRQGYTKEVVFLHYSILFEEECFTGFVDANNDIWVNAIRLTAKGYERLASLDRALNPIGLV